MRSCSRTAAAPSIGVSATRRLDELALRDRAGEQLRACERLPVGQPVLRERAQDAAVVVEDAAVPVAKRPRLE